MSLPGGRPIVVDNLDYEWIVKKDKRASSYEEDEYGNDYPVYDKVVTIKAKESGKLVQHRADRSAITPEYVALLIRSNVELGKL